MRLINSHSFAALLLAGSLVACTVGDTSTGRPMGEEGAADGGQTIVNPDAGVVTELKWSPTTLDQNGLKAAMHYVSPTEIYAVVDNKICIWNGVAWADHTLPIIGLATEMHFVTPTQIYSVVGNAVQMWDGLAWNIMTPNVAGINDGLGTADIHWVSNEEIYAVLLNALGEGRIAMYNGNAWVDMTDPMLGMKYELKVMPGLDPLVDPAIFYTVIDTEIQKWSGVLGQLGAWTIMSPAQLGLRPAIQVVSDTEMYAVIGDKVCKWDGVAWVDVTLDMAGLHTEFMRTSDEDIMAVAGTAVTHWAPVAAP